MRSKKNLALVVIDVQNAIDHPSWGRRNNPQAEINMAKLLEKFRSKGIQIIHIKHESVLPDSTYRPGQQGCEFKEEVKPIEGEKIFIKRVNSAFIGTGLDHWLRDLGINSLVIIGVITNNSVETTARMAGNLGYDIIIAADAVFTFNKKDYNGVLRTAEEVHAMSLANLADEYASIMITEDILALVDELPKT